MKIQTDGRGDHYTDARPLPHLFIGGDGRLEVPVVLAQFLPQRAQGFGVVLVHLLLAFLVFPELQNKMKTRRSKELYIYNWLL